MVTGTARWRELSRAAQEERAAAVAAHLDAGGLAVIPTETVYGLAALASRPAAMEAWRGVIGRTDGPATLATVLPATWHAPDVDAVTRAFALPTAVHRRLIARLLPGPVRFVLEQPAEVVVRWLSSCGVEPGVLDSDGCVAVRVPASPAARDVLARVSGPVVMAGIGRTAEFDAEAVAGPAGSAALRDAGAIEVIDDGRTAGALPSTVVRVSLNGAFEVEQIGEVSEADVMAALTRTVVFVCTGNTCRSPMAAALAEVAIAARADDGVSTRVLSAGVSAGRGAPATAEAAAAVTALGGDLSGHRSTPFSRELGRSAERIFAMTASHAAAIVSMDPTLADRVETLDPAGDIDDPIGGPLSLYEATAERLAMLVRRRLSEMDSALSRGVDGGNR